MRAIVRISGIILIKILFFNLAIKFVSIAFAHETRPYFEPKGIFWAPESILCSR
jgi:hypothetical protein